MHFKFIELFRQEFFLNSLIIFISSLSIVIKKFSLHFFFVFQLYIYFPKISNLMSPSSNYLFKLLIACNKYYSHNFLRLLQKLSIRTGVFFYDFYHIHSFFIHLNPNVLIFHFKTFHLSLKISLFCSYVKFT